MQNSEQVCSELTAAFAELLDEYLNAPFSVPASSFDGKSDEESAGFDQNAEQKSIANFMATPCVCGHGCQEQFSADEISDARADFRVLTMAEKNCFILGQLKSFMHAKDIARSGRSETLRERQKYAYRITADRPVCREMFLFYYGDTGKRLKRLQRYATEYGMSVRHGNTGRIPTHAIHQEDRGTVKAFIINYAAAHGLPDPGRDLRRGKGRLRMLLPTIMSYRSVHRVYEKSVRAQSGTAVSYKTFLRIWRDEVPHVEFNDPRTDLCMACEDFKKKINQVSAQLDEDAEAKKAQVYQQALEHIVDAKTERAYYNAAAMVAQNYYKKLLPKRALSPIAANSREIRMHYSWDFAQQLHYPYEDQQVGPIYFKTPRRAQLFGVCIEGIPCQVNYLIDEADFPEKDANTVISLLDHFFKHHGLGEKYVHLTADNCVGQNKNNAVLQYLLYRVLTEQHSKIELSFLIVGHTKFSPDGYFGLIRRQYRRSSIYTYDQLADAVENSSVHGHNVCQRYPDPHRQDVIYRNWTDWLDQFFTKLPNITSYQHFQIDHDQPGVILVRERAQSQTIRKQLLRKEFQPDWRDLKKGGPEKIAAPGLSAERQWYLYDFIRNHIPDQAGQDATCPEPTIGRPSRKSIKNH